MDGGIVGYLLGVRDEKMSDDLYGNETAEGRV